MDDARRWKDRHGRDDRRRTVRPRGRSRALPPSRGREVPARRLRRGRGESLHRVRRTLAEPHRGAPRRERGRVASRVAGVREGRRRAVRPAPGAARHGDRSDQRPRAAGRPRRGRRTVSALLLRLAEGARPDPRYRVQPPASRGGQERRTGHDLAGHRHRRRAWHVAGRHRRLRAQARGCDGDDRASRGTGRHRHRVDGHLARGRRARHRSRPGLSQSQPARRLDPSDREPAAAERGARDRVERRGGSRVDGSRASPISIPPTSNRAGNWRSLWRACGKAFWVSTGSVGTTTSSTSERIRSSACKWCPRGGSSASC